MRGRDGVVALVVALVGGVVACKHSPGHERRPCIVTDRETNALYGRLTPALHGADCTFEGLEGERERMTVTLAGADEPVVIAHPTCVAHAEAIGARYVIVTPAATAARCPDAVRRIRATLEGPSAH